MSICIMSFVQVHFTICCGQKLTKTMSAFRELAGTRYEVIFTVIVKDGITILTDTGKCIWWATQRIF